MFTKALLDKQFLNIEPTNLTGMVKFAWISQYNSIDQQVKGYKSKTKDPMQGGWVGGATRVDLPPTLQEEEKEKEKGEGKEQLHKKKKQKFINWFNEEKKIKTGKKGTIKILSTTDDNNLKKLFKEYKMEDFKIAFDNMFKSSWAVENGMCNISHLIRVDNFNKYLGQGASEGTGKTFSAFNK
jgi:hypothetical protein